MTLTPILLASLHGHGLRFEDPPAARRYLSTLAGQPLEVIIRKRRTQRTIDQNAYWWAVPVRLLADHCGYSDDQMHYALLGECFGYTVGPTGKHVPNKPASSKLTVDEFTRLIEWVLVWGPTEMGVEIPAPESVAT